LLICTYFLIHFYVNQEDKDLALCKKDSYTIKCYSDESFQTLKEQIPCSTDEDCINLTNFCSPGIPTLAFCVGFDIFCGKDKICKGCCPNFSS